MFKLVTWNIQSGRSPDGKTDLDRIIACLDRFCSFDMLCVQEVSRGYTPGGEDQFAMLRASACSPVRRWRAALERLPAAGPGRAAGMPAGLVDTCMPALARPAPSSSTGAAC
jgi:endonuclease/exonuclease/phosphatase family metal-dependent hydrolase